MIVYLGMSLRWRIFQAHSDHVGQNDVGSEPVGKAYRQDPGKSVVRSVENDKDDQPNADYSQTEDEKPLEKQRECSQNSSRMAPTISPPNPLASKRRSKPNELVPPPDLSIIHGGGADYPEIGSVLFETAVEAGITGFAIHRAQH